MSKEFKFIYVLGSLSKSKLVTPTLKEDDINKLIVTTEKDTLYGIVNLFIKKYF